MRNQRKPIAVQISVRLRETARRSIVLLTICAVVLAGCSNYKTVLQYPSGEKAEGAALDDIGADAPRFVLPAGVEIQAETVLIPPAPVEAERVVTGEPKLAKHTGWVRFRFNVDAAGKLSDIVVIRSSSADLQFAAKQLLREWAFTPATVDGRPVAFEGMEIVMGFSDTVTAGEAVGVGAAVIVLLPLALVALFIGAAAGVSNSMQKN